MFVKQQPIVLILFFSVLFLPLYPQNWDGVDSGLTIAFNPSQAPLGQGNSKADRLERGRQFAQSQRANNQSRHLSNSYYPHSNVCKQRIINDPYVFEVYHQNHNVHLYINNINDSYLPARIASRILLLESVLPPPYGKKLKKAIKKFTEKCVNSDGDLLEALAHIDERVFRDFLKASSLDVWLFHEKIDKIKKYEKRQLQGVYRVPKSCFLMNMIEHQAEWKYDKLTKFYQDSPYSGSLLARQLYNHYTKERFESPKNQAAFRQDPLWRNSTTVQRSDPAFQSKLLLRSLYARRLKGSISDTLAFSEEAVNMLYDVVDEQPNLRKMPNGYAESMIDRVIEKCCFEFARCPDDFKRVFFDASGVLKKYKDDFFVRTHFSSKKLNYKLQQSVNLALIMRDKVASHEGQAACQEILNKAAGSFYCASPDFAEDYETEAFDLSRQLVKNEFPVFQSVAMNAEKESQLYDLWNVFDGEHEDRARACEETVKTLFEDSTEYNDLTPEVKGFMQAHRLNSYFFSKVFGNQFQHQMTRELIDVVRMAATQKKHGFTADIANFAGLGQDFNLSKQFENTVTAADICWSLLKYGEAVVLGIWDTAESLANITQHPVKYVCDTAAGIGKLAFGILKYGYDLALVPEQARTTEAYLLKMCKDLKKVYDRSTGPECVRFGVHFISEAVVTRRAVSGLSKFVGKLARAVRNRPAWDAALAIESVAQDSNSARSFMGDVLYYCEDEFVSTKLGSKYGNATVSGFKHRHKIPNPSSLCKTRTAQLAVVEKDVTKLIGAGTGFTESMVKSASATVAKSGLTTTRKFLAPSLMQRLLPAVSSVAQSLKNKAIALISILKNRMNFLSGKSANRLNINFILNQKNKKLCLALALLRLLI